MSGIVTEQNLGDPVTQHMRSDFAQVCVDHTVGEALLWIRRNPPQGRIVYFYVLDQEGRLCGVVPTRRLLLNPFEKRISEIMIRDPIALPAHATVLDACEFFVLHRFLALPVVDAGRRLVGVVDMELYTNELNELSDLGGGLSDDLFQLAGVHVAKAKIPSLPAAFRNRFPWLLCNITGGIFAAFLTGLFQAELQHTVALALFIPVVLGLAESVSIQSLSLSLQFLHGPRPTWRGLLVLIRRELATGVVLGTASGALVAAVALAWLGGWTLALSIAGGIAGAVAGAATIGLAVPNILHLLRRNPHIAAGPVALALTDMITLVWYLMLARHLIGGG